jgi:hypothetical protein
VISPESPAVRRKSAPESRDIVVFTLHKSASMFIHKQCEILCRLSGIPYHSPNVPGCGLDARTLLTDRGIWTSRHGCFAPVRFFVDLPEIERYRIIVHLRDPRDVLVSMFYSYCYIHAGEIPVDTGYRREAAVKGIDAFVLAKASGTSSAYRGDYGTGGHVEDLIGTLPNRYRAYIDHLLGRPNVTFLKYEDMVFDYRGWLEKFVQSFPLAEPRSVVEQFAAQSSALFPRRSNDVMSHVRHITPGDYKNKLKPETIEKLDDIFSATLETLGYEKNAR